MSTWYEQRVIRRQGDEHGAVGGIFSDQIKTVIEELAEEREEAVGRSRQAVIRGYVVDEEALGETGNGGTTVGRVGRRRAVAERDDVVVDPGKWVDAENAV